MRIFRLVNSYEFYIDLAVDEKLIRIEIFEAADESLVFRTRVWYQNTYNLYPTFLNLGQNGEDLHRVYSSDYLNVDMTATIADSPEWLTGISFPSEKKFFEMIRANVIAFIEKSNKPA